MQGIQQVDYRSRRVQPHCVANPGVLGGVVAQNDGDALVPVGLEAQGGPFRRQPGQGVHPVRRRYVTLEPGAGQGCTVGTGVGTGSFFLEGNGHGNNAAIKLRQGHVHCGINRPQAQGVFLPFLAGAGADNPLDNWHVQRIQQVHRPAGGDGWTFLAQVAHRQAHGVDDAMHPGHSTSIGHKGGQGTAALPIFLRVMLEAVGVNRQDVDLLCFQAANKVVHELQVAAHPVSAVEQQANAGAIWPEPAADKAVNVIGFVCTGIRVVDAFPRHRLRGFVAVVAAQVSVAEEEEEVAEIGNPAAHQVGKDCFQFGHRHRAGGYQVFIPFLVAGTGNQGNPPVVAQANQRVKSVGHGPLAAQ